MATPQNSAPVATFSTLAATEEQAASGRFTATDADGDPLVFSIASNPTHGTLQLQPDGTFSYLPIPDYFGSDSFSYTVSDGKATVTQTVSITVSNLNDAPQLSGAIPTINLTQGTTMTPVVLPSATDADNDPLTYSLT